nr:LysR family transcriptional regulator [Enterovibrio nigricans]
MDIESLRSFLAIVDTGSFTRAAAQIHRTQSAISMQIKRLEEELDSPLFDREKRPLSLSLSGQRLVSHARSSSLLTMKHLTHLNGKTQPALFALVALMIMLKRCYPICWKA